MLKERLVPLKPYFPSIFSGALLVLCFPRFDLYPLAFVALVPFLVSLWGTSPGRAFKRGFVLGIPYFFGTLYWIYHSMNHYGGVSLPLSLFFVFLLSLYLSLYTGLFGALFCWKIRDTSLPALFLAPLFWVVSEFLRSYLLTGFPWSSIGYSQWKFTTFIQFADITGLYGVSFLVVAVNGALADVFIARNRRREMPLFHLTPTTRGAALLVMIVVAVFIYGSYRVGQERPGKTVRISVVQGNIEQDMKWDRRYQQEVIEKYERLTDAAMLQHPDIVVWPETALPFYFGADAPPTERLVSFQRGLGVYLLFGTITIKDADRASNSAVLLDGDGKAVYSYDKIHLVPFGEYVPLRKTLFFVNKLTYGIGDYVPGRAYLKADTPYGKFGTMICYEIIFPGLVRKFYRTDGDMIMTITNDAWFGDTSGPYQHWSMAALRAVENRKPVIRAANTGVSGFFDSNGRVLKETPVFKAKIITGDIKTDTTRSFYSRFGDLFVYICIVAAVWLVSDFRRR